MALTNGQKDAINLILHGDPSAVPPVLGWFAYEQKIIESREDIRAVVRLDAAGSLSNTLIEDIQAARLRASAAATALAALL
jgi:hypothetical protein